MPSENSLPDQEMERVKCGYGEHGFKPYQGPKDEPGKPHCLTCGHVWNECNWHWVAGEEPEEKRDMCGYCDAGLPTACTCPSEAPLSPEEEEELEAKWDAAERNEAPTQAAPRPQPVRRPPVAVAYAVDGGHRYEVLVPGDAMVIAEDGILKIVHGLPGFEVQPVLGIVYVRPVENGVAQERSADGAESEGTR